MEIRLSDNIVSAKTKQNLPIQSLRTKKSTDSSAQRVSNEQRTSLYDTLLDLVEEFDASGRAEIFRLLLERRSPIPLFLPNGEHHLAVLRLLNKATGNNRTICIGEDVNLLRLVVISCRKKADSKVTELLKEVFNLDSLHREDFARDSITRESMTAEIGLGCVVPLEENQDPVHLLVLNVVGDFHQLWNFIKSFSDYLIIEDATREEERFYRRPQFPSYKGSSSSPGLEGIDSVLVWKQSSDALVSEFQDGSDNYFGFEHLYIRTALCKAFNNHMVSDLLDPTAAHSKTDKKKIKLHLLESLLPGGFKGIECSVSANIKSSIECLQNFSTLRTNVLVLQKSFNEQAKLEEEQAQNRNDEKFQHNTNQLIWKQVALRKERASSVENNHLLGLFLHQLSIKDVNLRVLGFRELEKCLANQSEKALGPLRCEIDKLSIQYAELSQPKSGKNDRLQLISRQLLEAKQQYNTTVVSPEHLWRELSHLYAVNPSKYSKLTKLAYFIYGTVF